MSIFDRDEEEDDGSMFGKMLAPKMGSWSVYSKKYPRWNGEGRAKGLCCMGGPQEMEDFVQKKIKELGKENMPSDLEYFFMKD